MAPSDAAVFLADAPAANVGSTLSHMSRSFASACLEHTEVARGAGVLLTIAHHAAAALCRGVPAAKRRELFAAMPQDTATRLEALLAASADSVGALVDPRVLSVPEDVSMRHARTQFRRFGSRERTPLYAYVTRPDQTLAGVLSLRRVVMTGPGESVATAMRTPVVTIAAGASIEAVLRRDEWQRLHVLPVVDRVGVLLGTVRHDVLRGHQERQERQPGALVGLDVVRSFTEGYLKGLATLVMGLAHAGERGEETRS
jgi:magnesium transporter